MKIVKELICLVLFVIGMLFSLDVLGRIFTPKWLTNKDNSHTYISKGFYDEEENEFTNDNFVSDIFGNRAVASMCHNEYSDSWKDALSNAYSGFVMWIYLWMAIWIDCWIYYTAASKCNIWDACDDAECSLHGI